MKLTYSVLFLIMFLFGGSYLEAETVEEKYDNGKLKAKYSINKDNEKHGSYTGYHEDGKKKKIKAKYKDGVLDDKYVEYDLKGKVVKETVYNMGKLHGLYQEFEAKKLIVEKEYFNNFMLYGASTDVLDKKLKEIEALKPQLNDKKKPIFESYQEENLRNLKKYRYLSGVKFEHLEFDVTFNKQAMAAAKYATLKYNGQVTGPGAPKGMTQEEFNDASVGLLKCLQHYRTLAAGAYFVNIFSDYRWANAVRHVYPWDEIKNSVNRRYCLNPSLNKLGFGHSGVYDTFYCQDESYKDEDFDHYAFPPKGFAPSSYYYSGAAWHICFNAEKYNEIDVSKLSIKVYQVKAKDFKKLSDKLDFKEALIKAKYLDIEKMMPLKINVVNDGRMTGTRTVVFLPEGVVTTVGSKYLVEISGMETVEGNEFSLSYLTEFYQNK